MEFCEDSEPVVFHPTQFCLCSGCSTVQIAKQLIPILILTLQTAAFADDEVDDSANVAKSQLRQVPPICKVKSITATWFDPEYRSFVRGWKVPRDLWKQTLHAARESRTLRPRSVDEKDRIPVHLHLRINTADDRSLLIVAEQTGTLKAYGEKSCRSSFRFSNHATSPFLQQRLGTLFRIEQSRSERNPSAPDQHGNR